MHITQSKTIHPENSQNSQQEKKKGQESVQKKSLSKPKASTHLTSKESSVSILNEPLISTTSKQHSTPRPKDPIPKEDRNNAVYQLNCKDCEAVYVDKDKANIEHKS